MSRHIYLILALLLIILGTSYVSASWIAPSGGTVPSGNNTTAPVSTSTAAQIKEGPLTLYKTLWVYGLSGKLIVDGAMGVGSGFTPTTNWTSPAVLDVNGRIRIRGGGPSIGEVLTSDASGLASWEPLAAGIPSITEGYGIELTDTGGNASATVLTNGGTVAIKTTETQKRVTGACTSNNAITRIDEGGSTDCQYFVTQVVPGPGLTGSGSGTGSGGGPVNLALNLAPNAALSTNGSGQIQANVTGTTGDGLQIDGSNNLKLESCTAANPFLKWDNTTSKWVCAASSVPSNPTPGGSIMYIRQANFLNMTSGVCPTAGNGGSSMDWQTIEVLAVNPGHATNMNYSAVCYNTTQSCQVLYLTSLGPTPPACPTTPVAFYEQSLKNVWGPGGLSTFSERVCFKCY